ncbi:MAG: hypothetical protein ACLT38_09815 [Akkermansia sp.]
MHNVGVGSGVDVNTISREAFILGGLIGTAIHSIGRASLNIDLEPTAVAKKRANQKNARHHRRGSHCRSWCRSLCRHRIYGREKAEEILAGVQPTVTSIKSAQSALRQKEQELKKLDSTGFLPAAHASALRLRGHHQAPAGTVGTQGLSLLVYGF